MQNKKDLAITYVFNSGREKFINNSHFSKEFLYFYPQVSEKYNGVEYLEVNENSKINFFLNIYKYMEKILSKILKVPLFGYKILNIKNMKRLAKSKHIILTTENIGYSLTVFIFFLKLFKSFKVTIFFMGISNINPHKLGRLFTLLMFSTFDNLLFLSKGEKEYVSKDFSSYSYKMSYLPFSIDINFWKNKNEIIEKKDLILFNGNDLQRDYSFLQDLIDNLPHFKFLILSKRFETISGNTELIKTNMRNPKITDHELKKIYEKSFVSIIPLIQTKQPSGQSVAMQSMAMRVPVIMTKTNGFWDHELFEDTQNIFLKNNILKEWINIINRIYEEPEYANKVTNSALNVIEKNYSYLKISEDFFRLLDGDKS